MVFVGCSKKEEDIVQVIPSTIVTISGSNIVSSLIEEKIEKFEEENKDIKVKIDKSDSYEGIKDVVSGKVQIGMVSRDLTNEEKSNGLIEVEIAKKQVAIITNKDNKVNSLTFQQVKDIFLGKITNWSEVGGENSNIKVISLNDTEQKSIFRQVLQYINYEILKEDVLVENFSDMKTRVEEDKNAIGVVFDEYIDDNIKNISIDGS